MLQTIAKRIISHQANHPEATIDQTLKVTQADTFTVNATDDLVTLKEKEDYLVLRGDDNHWEVQS